MSIRTKLALGCLLLGGLPVAQAADAMRCGSRLVTVEDRAAEILSACGEPDFRDRFGPPPGEHPAYLSEVEQWTYNFGPNQLLRVLTLRNGRLSGIESAGYGFLVPARRRCGPGEIADGLTKYRLLQSCGEPLTRRALGYFRAYRPHRHRDHGGYAGSRNAIAVEVYREEWVYNLGRQHRLRVVTLENGRVAEVESGAQGFDPR